MSRESLHNKFLEAVKKLNLAFPVAEIADKMKVGQPIVSTYLNSKRNVSPKFAQSFCEAFGLSSLDEASEQGDKLSDRELISMFLTVSKTQTAILNRIEEGMAKEKTLASIETNYLKRTLAAALTAVKNQDDDMHEIRGLFSQLQVQKTGSSRGDDKVRGRKNGGLQKKGNRPA